MLWKMCRTASYHHKLRFVKCCRHYVVARPNSPKMTKEFFEAHLIGLALQARLPDPGPTLGNGRWAKELLKGLVPDFEWSCPKGRAAKATTTAIAFVNTPVMFEDGTSEEAQHQFLCDYLHLESSTLTPAQLATLHHIGMHSKAQAAGTSSPQTAAGGLANCVVAVPPEVERMGALIRADGERSWVMPFGGAVAAFFVFGGPPEVTSYIWHTKACRVDDFYIEHRPAVTRASINSTHRHTYLDTFEPTPMFKAHRAPPAKILYCRELFCLGRPSRTLPTSGGEPTRPNCARACGGIGVCAPHCPGPTASSAGREGKYHCCAARLRIELTAALMKCGEVRITMAAGHSALSAGEALGSPACELIKHHTALINKLASAACQVEFEKQQVIMRDNSFKERLVLILSCERRVRDYLFQFLPRLTEG